MLRNRGNEMGDFRTFIEEMDLIDVHSIRDRFN